jgi:hypothetical protein
LSPLRSDGSRDDQAGEAGPVEHSSAEAKSLKTKAKGPSSCHSSGQQPRQPDGGLEGQIKNYSHDNLLKKTELNAALAGITIGQKAARQRKQRLRKRKGAYSMLPILKLQKGVMSERGEGAGSHTLPEHVTGNGRLTQQSRRVITLRPGALLEISFLFI